MEITMDNVARQSGAVQHGGNPMHYPPRGRACRPPCAYYTIGLRDEADVICEVGVGCVRSGFTRDHLSTAALH